MAVSEDNLKTIEIENLTYDIYLGELNVIGFVRLTKKNFERLDLIINDKYGDINLLGQVLAFNGITDPITLKPGMGLMLPDIADLCTHVVENKILSEGKVPGINQRLVSDNIKLSKPGKTKSVFVKEKTLNSRITRGNPKLNIILKQTEYNPIKGKIIF